MLEPNQFGTRQGALSGWVDACLTSGLTLADQARYNRALVRVPIGDLVYRAHFEVETDGPGTYLVTLHLRNIYGHEVRVRNVVRGHPPGWYGYLTRELVDETNTIAPGETLILPVLFPTEREPHRGLWWKAESLTIVGGSHYDTILSLQAVTVDKLPIR